MNYCLRNGFLLQQRPKFTILNKSKSSFNASTSIPNKHINPTKQQQQQQRSTSLHEKNLGDTIMSNNNCNQMNIDSDRLQLRNLCISIEKIVQDVERDNIGNRWNSLYLINGYVHNFEDLNMRHNQIKLNRFIANSLIDIIFKFYYVSQQMIIDETLIKIDIGIKVTKFYDDLDDKKWIDPNNKSLIKQRATLNPKYKKNLKQLKERLKWCQIW